MSSSINVASKILKFATIVITSAFCVLAANHYYEIKKYSQSLLPGLVITIFIDKNAEDDAKVCEAIKSLGFVTIDEYAGSQEVYEKAVEKNPFLKDISVPRDSEIFQSYIKASPAALPTDDFLIEARNAIAELENVSEIVFNPENFQKYVRNEKLLAFYHGIFIIFAVIISVLLTAQSILFILQSEENSRKLITNCMAYLLSSSVGFIGMWSGCLFAQYPLIIDEIAAFYIIPFTAAFGIIFEG
ncbi:MAG: hypothetical protein LBD46_02545 [Endomicrobium sp.]|jgi:cell division transport system permease protein|nr:hypothetical protein [Endomicrobium sp.]